MLQFVIAESTLQPYGQIETIIKSADGETSALTNDRYITHEEFDINDAGIKDGIDYHTLTYANRLINLDTITAPPGKLITGIRFHVTNDGRLSIQIRATDFNYVTGKEIVIVMLSTAVYSISICVDRKIGKIGSERLAFERGKTANEIRNFASRCTNPFTNTSGTQLGGESIHRVWSK